MARDYQNTLKIEEVREVKRNETFEEMVVRFNEDERTFICTEALRLFHQALSDEIALEALKFLESASQPF